MSSLTLNPMARKYIFSIVPRRRSSRLYYRGMNGSTSTDMLMKMRYWHGREDLMRRLRVLKVYKQSGLEVPVQTDISE